MHRVARAILFTPPGTMTVNLFASRATDRRAYPLAWLMRSPT